MKPGYVVIGPNGHVLTDGFDHDASVPTCREASIIEMRWAIEQLNASIVAAQTPPYTEQTCAADFSEALMTALHNALRRESWLREVKT